MAERRRCGVAMAVPSLAPVQQGSPESAPLLEAGDLGLDDRQGPGHGNRIAGPHRVAAHGHELRRNASRDEGMTIRSGSRSTTGIVPPLSAYFPSGVLQRVTMTAACLLRKRSTITSMFASISLARTPCRASLAPIATMTRSVPSGTALSSRANVPHVVSPR